MLQLILTDAILRLLRSTEGYQLSYSSYILTYRPHSVVITIMVTQNGATMGWYQVSQSDS